MTRKSNHAAHALRIVIASFALFSCIVAPAHAAFTVQQEHAFPKPSFNEKPIGTSKEPVLLSADRVDYDHENAIVVATGHVEIAQGQTIVLADQVTYDQGKDTVSARGNVSILEPSGNVYFADAMELQDDLKSGVIHQFKARLSDNSVAVATQAHKINESVTELFKMAYTPCSCTDADGKTKTPLWQIKADDATIDQQAQEMYYDGAMFDMDGLPVMYAPWFSHPTPGADNQSGLLTPTFMQSQNLGPVFRIPVYYAIAPDKDATFTPMYTGKSGPVAIGEYRQMFDEGSLKLDGSITSAPNTDGAGDPIAGHEIRGNVDAVGSFKIPGNYVGQYDWGFDVHRATDDTYLHLYDFSNDPLLTSKIYAEGFDFIGDGDRSYASIKGLSFQGLTGLDNSKLIPVVAPLADVTWQSEPGLYDSRITLSGDTMSLYRVSGDESRRVSGTASWNLPYISPDGQVIAFDAQMRTDVYDVNSVLLPDGTHFSGVTGREVPEASVMWSYPLINRFDKASVTLEPIVDLVASPGGGNPDKIPNEDSLLPDFTDANLFSTDRFAGFDRIETGPRMSYGVRGQALLNSSGQSVDWLLGQQYRVTSDADFPISNDPSSHFSDYVGKVGLSWQPYTLAYRFRLDRDDLSANRNEFDAGFNEYPFTLNTSYLDLRDDPVLGSKEFLNGNAAINLTKEWSWNFNGSRDLELGQTVTAYTGLGFKNECVNITSMVGKDYTSLLDIKPSLTFWFRVSLKNLD